jgi:hypothetical protein
MCDASRYAEWGALTLEIPRTDGPARMVSTYDEGVPFTGRWKAVLHWRVSESSHLSERQVHTGQVWYARSWSQIRDGVLARGKTGRPSP